MKKMKLSHKTVLSLVLSAVLLCMPVAAFAMNEGNAISVQAEDLKQEESTSGQDVQNTENATEETATEAATTESTEGSTGEIEEGGTVSGNDIAEPVCICEDRCGAYDYDRDCEVCAEDYRECEYKTPNVRITINQPQGWYNDSATVTFGVKDIASTGNFEIAMVQAKVGQNGSWSEVTEDMELEVSENCTVYVLVTDQKGNTYEKNRSIRCFDTIRPTLNAAVSDGLLSVQVHDTDSGAKAVYVNGYEFTNLTNGTLNIRLQQFDAGYQYFTISALDNAGNMSEVYKTANPYYKDPADESDENPAEQLPESAEATKPGNATAIVTEHTKTDSNGNTTSQMSAAEQKKQAFAEADKAEQEELGQEEKEAEQGKEFYTIQTATDKVFYLIIDRDGEQEMVYFLTEITENDLLNVTSDNSETLPKNSAALESAIPVTDSALPNNNTEPEDVEQTEAVEGTEENTEDAEQEQEPEEQAEPNPMISYVLIGGFAVAFIGGAYYFKVVRKKKEDFIEDEDEDEEDEEEVFENEDEDESDDDFFDEDQQ